MLTILKKSLLPLLLTFSSSIMALPTSIVDGKQYTTVAHTTQTENEIIEVFSFYCGSCFNLDRSGGNELLKEKLPKEVKFSRYLLNVSSPIADQLQTSWAIANVLNIQDEFATQVFNGIFITKKMNTEADIIKVLNGLGVETTKYEAMKKDPLVLSFTKKEQDMLKTLRPGFTPAIYVNQKYLLNPNALGNNMTDYIQTISFLLTLPATKS